MRNLSGFSILEVILAAALFVVIASTALATIIYNFNTNRLGSEETRASYLAQEGIGAVRYLKKIDWSNLQNGTHGLSASTGQWQFLGESDTNGKYTRQILIEDVFRDAGGDIASSGTLDPYVKKITTTISWDFAPSRNNQVSIVTYLANWERPVVVNQSGLLAYANTNLSAGGVSYKLFDAASSSWGAEETVPNFGGDDVDIRRVELYSSPTRDEKILITKHSNGTQYLYAHVWNGSEWANQIKLTEYNSDYNPNIRNFDGAYNQSGDFVVIYSDLTFIPKVRRWDGSDWSSESSTVNIWGYPVWIVVKNLPGSDNYMVVVKDFLLRVQTFWGNGSNWGNLKAHSVGTYLAVSDNISFAWSDTDTSVGALMYTDWLFDDTPNIKISNDGGGWQSSTENIDIGRTIVSLEISARPGYKEFIGCATDSRRDTSCLFTDDTPLWQEVDNGKVAKNTDDGKQKSVAFTFESSGDEGVVMYAEGGQSASRRIPKYRIYDAGAKAFSEAFQLPELGPTASYGLETVRAVSNRESSDILFAMGDSEQDLTTVFWNGSSNEFYDDDERGMVKQAYYGSNDVDYWFDFEWDLHE